jgi:predicted transport protein
MTNLLEHQNNRLPLSTNLWYTQTTAKMIENRKEVSNLEEVFVEQEEMKIESSNSLTYVTLYISGRILH